MAAPQTDGTRCQPKSTQNATRVTGRRINSEDRYMDAFSQDARGEVAKADRRAVTSRVVQGTR
jgi:hypothetical protein